MRYLLAVLIAGAAFAHGALACPGCFPGKPDRIVIEKDEGVETVISGTVKDADGNAVQNALVVITVIREVQPRQCAGCDDKRIVLRRPAPAFRLMARTNADGAFELKTRNLPEGKFQLSVRGQGFEAIARTIELTAGEKNELAEITLEAAKDKGLMPRIPGPYPGNS